MLSPGNARRDICWLFAVKLIFSSLDAMTATVATRSRQAQRAGGIRVGGGLRQVPPAGRGLIPGPAGRPPREPRAPARAASCWGEHHIKSDYNRRRTSRHACPEGIDTCDRKEQCGQSFVGPFQRLLVPAPKEKPEPPPNHPPFLIPLALRYVPPYICFSQQWWRRQRVAVSDDGEEQVA